VSPEYLILGVMIVGLTLYAVLAGAAFGGGVWEFNLVLRAPESDRKLIYRAIGPVWEANHVWLIFILVGLWSAFPPAFAGVTQALWVPLSLALLGIIFRGVGFVFRSHVSGHVGQERMWGAVFAVASAAAPFFLGAAAGALASGRAEVALDGTPVGDVVFDWIGLTPIFGAFFTVGACAFLAATFLTREAHLERDGPTTERWRKRALATGAVVGGLATGGIAVLKIDDPELWDGFTARAWPLVERSDRWSGGGRLPSTPTSSLPPWRWPMPKVRIPCCGRWCGPWLAGR
jgi:cytochrome d ubiquinol oxidase subunit II